MNRQVSLDRQSQNLQLNGGRTKSRTSSFASPSSPYVRRNSFLSPDMVQHENFLVYESTSFLSDSSTYNIISLKECQGFIFNQDLFASPYQQSRSLANEKKIRALSYSKVSSTSRANSTFPSIDCTSFDNISKQRRHTSYHSSRPLVLSGNEVSMDTSEAVFEDDEDDRDVDVDVDVDVEMHLEDGLDNAIDDDYDEEYEEMNEYGGDANNRRYKVQVTDIIIDENEVDIFPK